MACRPDPPWPWRYPWISVGVLGTDGGHLGRLPLYFPSPPPLRHILLLLSICSLSFVSSFAERYASRLFFLPLSLPFSFSLLYLFILLGRRPLFVPWRAGRLAARSSLDVAPSNTSALETATFDDVLPKRAYSDLPRLAGERKKEGVPTWQVGRYTPHFGGPANFGYSPCQQGRSFSWRCWSLVRHLPSHLPF